MLQSVVWPALQGFGLGASLIIAIGAQNAFVLKLGLLRLHVGPVVAFCAFSDALLIAAGIAGMGSLITAHPLLLLIAGTGGCLFLLAYGLRACHSAMKRHSMAANSTGDISLRAALLLVASFTWLNPHVYLDTVVLLGSLGGRLPPGERFAFAAGAMLASLLWFTALGYGARLLAPLFAKPRSWQVLDGLIGVVMLSLAAAVGWDTWQRIGS